MSEDASPCVLQKFSNPARRRRDVPPNDLARGAIDDDPVRASPVDKRCQPDGGVEELRVLHGNLRVGVLDLIDGVLEQFPLVRLDLFPSEPGGLVLVELRIQEAGTANHSRGVEGYLVREGDLVLSSGEVAPPPAEDLPEIVPGKAPDRRSFDPVRVRTPE